MSSIVPQVSTIFTSIEKTEAQGGRLPLSGLAQGGGLPLSGLGQGGSALADWAFCVLFHYIYPGTQQGRKGTHFTAEAGEAWIRGAASHPGLDQHCPLGAHPMCQLSWEDLELSLPRVFPCGVEELHESLSLAGLGFLLEKGNSDRFCPTGWV